MSEAIALAALTDADRRLVEAAREAARNAYAPYSGFAVGAAVRTKAQRVYRGANLENAAYGLAICAEAAALTAANTAGDFSIEAIAVLGVKFTVPTDGSTIAMPCGRCRQMLAEAAQIAQTTLRVIACSFDLDQIVAAEISELLPLPFGPQTMGITRAWPPLRAQLQALGAKGLPGDTTAGDGS